MDLTTRYLGLTLRHPFVCGASPLSADLGMVLRLEDGGAAAIVMHSLFEEQILKDAMSRFQLFREPRHSSDLPAPSPPLSAYNWPPGRYLEHLLRLKQRVRITLIASLNGTTPEGWLKYARALESAGADALELNFYYIAIDPTEDAHGVEQRVLDVVAVVKESISIPLAVKLSPFYSSLPNLAARLDRMGGRPRPVQSLLSGRHRPETRGAVVRLQLSDSSDLLLRLHSVAILSDRVRMSLAIS
jgi:dihydroorotate dehydrogenase (fumarate)